MFRSGDARSSPDPGAESYAAAQRLYDAARALAGPSDSARYVEALKQYLAFVEHYRKELQPYADPLAGQLDEAAVALYRASQPTLAARAVEVGLGFAPRSAALLHHKALILLAQNRNLEFVLPLLDQALQLAPLDKGIWGTKGDALQILGKPDLAVEAYLRAQQLDATSSQYADRALKLSPRNPAALRAKLEIARTRGGEEEALHACEELLVASPGDPELLLARADLQLALADLEGALASIEAVRTAHPDDVRGLDANARLLFLQGHPTEAEAQCRELLASKGPFDPLSLASLADRAARSGGSSGLVLELREKLRSVDPRNLANLQALRALAAQEGKHDLAIEVSRLILAASPNNLEAMRVLAELYLAVGRPEEALQQYRELVRAHPSEVEEIRKAMVAARGVGRPEVVRECAEAILRAHPDDAGALEQLATAYRETGRPQDALQVYEHLLASRPGTVDLLVAKKSLLTELQRWDLLPAVLDELFRLDPTRSDLALERGNLYLQMAYRLPDGSAERATAARTSMVSYERASVAEAYRSSSLLGLARAGRVVHMPDRAIQYYSDFLALPGNERRADAHKELGHILREANRFRDAEEQYAQAIQLGLDEMDLLWGEVEVLTQLNQEGSALRYVDLLLLREPRNPLFLRRRGHLLLKLDRRAEGLQALTAAVAASGPDPLICFEVGDALRLQGSYPDAIQYYEAGLRLDPKHRAGRLSLAEALLKAGRYNEVLPIVDGLLHEDPNELGAWRVRAEACRALHRADDLQYSLKAMLLLDPNHGAALREKGELHLAAGEKDAAFECYRRLTTVGAAEATDPELWLTIADIASDLGKVEEANAAFDRVAEIDPARAPEIATRRARLRLQAGRPDLALELLDQVKAPEGAAVPVASLLLRAEVLLALERTTDARQVYSEVVAREPGNASALAGLGRILLDEGKASEALQALDEALRQVPEDEGLYLLRAEAQAASGALAEAATGLEAAAARLPRSMKLWGRLGEVQIRLEAWPKAAEATAHARALDPEDVELTLRAGFIAEKLGHENEALALYEHATKVAPGNKFAWCSHGLALLAVGQSTEAVASFDRALGLDSDFEAAKDGRKTALQRTKEATIERMGREALLLEAKLGRPVARNDLFVTLHVPYDLLDPLLQALGRTPRIDLSKLSEQEVHDLEVASCQLVTSALERRPESIERRGLTLADVAVLAPPTYTLAELQKLFGYVRSVLELDLRAENLVLTPEVEELARRALVLPPEHRTLFQIVRSLRVGLYKARVIKTVEEAGSAVHAPLPTVDLGQFTPEFRSPEEGEGAVAGAAGPAGASGFFPLDDEAVTAPTIVEPTLPSAVPAASPLPSEARCVGCMGVASVVHSCGAPLCQHCIAQYRTCPKCSLAVDASNARSLHPTGHRGRGPAAKPAPKRPARSEPKPSGTSPPAAAPRRPERPSAAPAPAPAKSPPKAPTVVPPVASPPTAPAAEPAAPRRLEKKDDEPRL
jgi:tetratricopeptide (TPR) repeat protein